jgi:hypothetical protein
VIPKSVTSIGGYAFYNCSLTIGFKADTLPNTLGWEWNGENEYYLGIKELTTNDLYTYLIDKDDNAVILKFVGTETELIIDKINGYDVVSIGGYAFSGCSSLTSIVISEGVTSIGDYAFSGCSSLTSIVISEAVTSIREYLFSNCSSLTSIVIPESVAIIEDNAFYSCEKLLSIEIKGYLYIDDYAFNGIMCEIVFDKYKEAAEGWSSSWNQGFSGSITYLAEEVYQPFYTDGLSFSLKNGSYSLTEYSGTATEVVIPKIYQGILVTSIGYGAFFGCSGLTSIVIPESVTSIESYAFYDCSSLTSIGIPESVTSIGSSAFSFCRSLTSIVIPEGVTSISNSAFYGCSNLMSVAIPEEVTSIGNNAFTYCSNLTSVNIKNRQLNKSAAEYNVI